MQYVKTYCRSVPKRRGNLGIIKALGELDEIAQKLAADAQIVSVSDTHHPTDSNDADYSALIGRVIVFERLEREETT